MNKSRVLVLGCNDVIGQAVATALAGSDWATPVVLASEQSAQLRHAEYIQDKALNPTTLGKIYTEADAIVAAFSGSPQSILSQANALFTAGATPWQHKRIVHVSSMTVYGTATGVVNEDSSSVGDLSAYAMSRVESERLAIPYADVITLRPGVEYGPNCSAWSERVARWLLAGRIGDLGALGDGYCNLVYIDDLASATLKALRYPGGAQRVFNVAAPAPLTWNDYFLRYAKALGAVPLKRIPQRQLRIETKLLAPPLKIAEIVGRSIGAQWLTRLPAIPPSVLSTFRQEIMLDATRATTALEINWMPLAEGLQLTANWFHGRTAQHR